MPAKTMQMIANELGLNRATVSLVINGKARERRISSQTIDRVQAYLRRVGYVPDQKAVSLRMGQRNRVGILYCGHLYSHLTVAFNRMVEALNAGEAGVEIVVRPRDRVLDGLRELVGRGVRRAVWIATERDSIPQEDRAEVLALGGRLQMVIYNYLFDVHRDLEKELLTSGFSLIGVSRRLGYQKMADLFREVGYRRVLLADVPAGDSLSPMDQDIYNAMTSKGLEIMRLEQLLPQESDLVRRGHQLGGHILEAYKGQRFDAIALRDDEVAAAVISRLLSSGVRIPEDIGLCSMDGNPLAGLLRVPLTTLSMPVSAMVRRTLELVEAEEPFTSRKHRFQLSLQRRASHAPINIKCP